MDSEKELNETKEKEIRQLVADIEKTQFKNITHPKSRLGFAIALYEMGYRIPEANTAKNALKVALNWIRAKSVFSSLNSEHAPDVLKAKSPKGLFISFDDFNSLYNAEFNQEGKRC